MVTFDGINKQIVLPSTGSYDVGVDLYGDWKEWVAMADNAKFFPAFDTTGGDDVGSGEEISSYFFLRTDLGWRIKSPEQDGDVIIRGNLFPRVAGDTMFLPSTGDFTVLISQNVSAQSLTKTNIPTISEIENVAATLTEEQIHSILDSYNNKNNWKSDVSAISTEIATGFTNNKNDLVVINSGIKKASLLIPHSTELT